MRLWSLVCHICALGFSLPYLCTPARVRAKEMWQSGVMGWWGSGVCVVFSALQTTHAESNTMERVDSNIMERVDSNIKRVESNTMERVHACREQYKGACLPVTHFWQGGLGLLGCSFGILGCSLGLLGCS